jgi:hypothetical protein
VGSVAVRDSANPPLFRRIVDATTITFPGITPTARRALLSPVLG